LSTDRTPHIWSSFFIDEDSKLLAEIEVLYVFDREAGAEAFLTTPDVKNVVD
jgi:hypothetical protein